MISDSSGRGSGKLGRNSGGRSKLGEDSLEAAKPMRGRGIATAKRWPTRIPLSTSFGRLSVVAWKTASGIHGGRRRAEAVGIDRLRRMARWRPGARASGQPLSNRRIRVRMVAMPARRLLRTATLAPTLHTALHVLRVLRFRQVVSFARLSPPSNQAYKRACAV
jgi:hypothetical protein